jgi:hypothetical protein
MSFNFLENQIILNLTKFIRSESNFIRFIIDFAIGLNPPMHQICPPLNNHRKGPRSESHETSGHSVVLQLNRRNDGSHARLDWFVDWLSYRAWSHGCQPGKPCCRPSWSSATAVRSDRGGGGGSTTKHIERVRYLHPYIHVCTHHWSSKLNKELLDQCRSICIMYTYLTLYMSLPHLIGRHQMMTELISYKLNSIQWSQAVWTWSLSKWPVACE